MNARRLLLALILAAGCATPAPDHGRIGVNNTIAGIETATLYSATASSYANLVPSYANHNYAQCYAHGGTFWVKHATPEETPASFTTPIPSANAQAAGWTRLLDTESVTWGREGVAVTANEQTYFVRAWPEGGGDLMCVWH
jgi:hypothetical protein